MRRQQNACFVESPHYGRVGAAALVTPGPRGTPEDKSEMRVEHIGPYALVAAWVCSYPPPPPRPARPGQARWRRAVLERDGFVCTVCGERRDLEAHHLRPWATCLADRLDPDNGRTLCAACHQDTHHPVPDAGRLPVQREGGA